MIPQEYFDKIKKHFRGDPERVWGWLTKAHPSLGGQSPLEVLKTPSANKVKKLIDEMR